MACADTVFRTRRAMMTMSNDFTLPERLDTASAGRLAGRLSERRGQPLRLDGSAVGFGGALGLQVLVAARRQWQADGQPFRIDPLGDGLARACRILGIPPLEIGAGDDSDTEEDA